MHDPSSARALLLQIEGGPARPALPQVEAPSLESIRVIAPTPAPIERSDIADYIGFLEFTHAERRRRRPGEKVESGDEVDVDVIGYFDGKIVPSMCAEHINVPVISGVLADGFYEHLIGQEVGTSSAAHVQVSLEAESEPIPCVWAIHIRRASEVTQLSSHEPRFWAAVGAQNETEMLPAVVGQMGRTRLIESWSKGVDLVYSELKRRAHVVIPQELLDYECALVWLQQQGRLLERAGISVEERASCLAHAIAHPKLRSEVEHRLAVKCILDAVAQKDGLEPTTETAVDAFEELAKSLNVKKPELAKVFAQDEAALKTFAGQFGFQRVVAHVLSKVELIVPGYPT